MSLLKQDTTKKGQINECTKVLEFEAGNNTKYKVEAIQDSVVYAKEVDRCLPGLYYLLA